MRFAAHPWHPPLASTSFFRGLEGMGLQEWFQDWKRWPNWRQKEQILGSILGACKMRAIWSQYSENTATGSSRGFQNRSKWRPEGGQMASRSVPKHQKNTAWFCNPFGRCKSDLRQDIGIRFGAHFGCILEAKTVPKSIGKSIIFLIFRFAGSYYPALFLSTGLQYIRLWCRTLRSR